MRILIVDDDKQYCLTLKRYLKKNEQYHLTLAFDGNEAKHAITGADYDVIFLDCDMPYVSGVDLIRVIKKEIPRARIIMISGYEGIDEEFAQRAGVTDFIKKPFSVKQLEQVLEKYEREK